MAAEGFRLEQVLRVARSKEEQAQQHLAQLAAERERAHAQLRALREQERQQLSALRDRGQARSLDPAAHAAPLDAESPLPERVALLFGTEGVGLGDAVLAVSDTRVRIEMSPGFDSVNVATASGIVLHEAYRARRRGGRS